MEVTYNKEEERDNNINYWLNNNKEIVEGISPPNQQFINKLKELKDKYPEQPLI